MRTSHVALACFGLTLLAAGSFAQTQTSLQGIITYNYGTTKNDTKSGSTALSSAQDWSTNSFPAGDEGAYTASVDPAGQQIQADLMAAGELIGSVSTFPAGAYVGASLQYSFQVVGPQNINIPIIMLTPHPLLQWTSSDVTMKQFDGNAHLAVGASVYHGFGTNQTIFGESEDTSHSFNASSFSTVDTFVPSESFNLIANSDTTYVAMRATMQVFGHITQLGGSSNYGKVTNTGHMFFDPFVMIDPTFADAANYHIVFSDGVTNPTPEPGTWLVMGLGGLALVRRRAKR